VNYDIAEVFISLKNVSGVKRGGIPDTILTDIFTSRASSVWGEVDFPGAGGWFFFRQDDGRREHYPESWCKNGN